MNSVSSQALAAGAIRVGTTHVTVLMGLHHGRRYLPDQLASLAAQDHGAWSLVVSDDGGDDGARDTLDAFSRSSGRDVSVRTGPGKGFARNFLSMLGDIGPKADVVAFCDQDDWWLPGKLSRAVTALSPYDGPALYGGRTVLCDAALAPIGVSPLFRRPPAFQNALVQSIAGGNTMVLNRPAIALLRRAAERHDSIVAHDWWAYQIVSGAGGAVIYDGVPQVLYRQHGANQIGANRSVGSRARRATGVIDGRMVDWTDRTLASLQACADLLTPDAGRTLEAFAGIRHASPVRRIGALRRSGVYRQTRAETAALGLAAALGTL